MEHSNERIDLAFIACLRRSILDMIAFAQKQDRSRSFEQQLMIRVQKLAVAFNEDVKIAGRKDLVLDINFESLTSASADLQPSESAERTDKDRRSSRKQRLNNRVNKGEKASVLPVDATPPEWDAIPVVNYQKQPQTLSIEPHLVDVDPYMFIPSQRPITSGRKKRSKGKAIAKKNPQVRNFPTSRRLLTDVNSEESESDSAAVAPAQSFVPTDTAWSNEHVKVTYRRARKQAAPPLAAPATRTGAKKGVVKRHRFTSVDSSSSQPSALSPGNAMVTSANDLTIDHEDHSQSFRCDTLDHVLGFATTCMDKPAQNSVDEVLTTVSLPPASQRQAKRLRLSQSTSNKSESETLAITGDEIANSPVRRKVGSSVSPLKLHTSVEKNIGGSQRKIFTLSKVKPLFQPVNAQAAKVATKFVLPESENSGASSVVRSDDITAIESATPAHATSVTPEECVTKHICSTSLHDESLVESHTTVLKQPSRVSFILHKRPPVTTHVVFTRQGSMDVAERPLAMPTPCKVRFSERVADAFYETMIPSKMCTATASLAECIDDLSGGIGLFANESTVTSSEGAEETASRLVPNAAQPVNEVPAVPEHILVHDSLSTVPETGSFVDVNVTIDPIDQACGFSSQLVSTQDLRRKIDHIEELDEQFRSELDMHHGRKVGTLQQECDVISVSESGLVEHTSLGKNVRRNDATNAAINEGLGDILDEVGNGATSGLSTAGSDQLVISQPFEVPVQQFNVVAMNFDPEPIACSQGFQEAMANAFAGLVTDVMTAVEEEPGQYIERGGDAGRAPPIVAGTSAHCDQELFDMIPPSTENQKDVAVEEVDSHRRLPVELDTSGASDRLLLDICFPSSSAGHADPAEMTATVNQPADECYIPAASEHMLLDIEAHMEQDAHLHVDEPYITPSDEALLACVPSTHTQERGGTLNEPLTSSVQAFLECDMATSVPQPPLTTTPNEFSVAVMNPYASAIFRPVNMLNATAYVPQQYTSSPSTSCTTRYATPMPSSVLTKNGPAAVGVGKRPGSNQSVVVLMNPEPSQHTSTPYTGRYKKPVVNVHAAAPATPRVEGHCVAPPRGYLTTSFSSSRSGEQEQSLRPVPRPRMGFGESGRIVCCYSNLGDGDKDFLNMRFAMLPNCQISVVREFSLDVTHVILKAIKGTKSCLRTLKFFLGTAAKKFVVSFEWVEACVAAHRLLPAEPYEITGDDSMVEPHYGPKKSRLDAQGVFAGYFVYLYGDQLGMCSCADLVNVVRFARGTVVDSLESLELYRSNSRVACIQTDDPAEAQAFRERCEAMEVPCVAREWFLDSVARHTIMDMSAYINT